MRYGLTLYSKYTGESITLGITFNSREDAQKYIDEDNICLRCNRVEIIYVRDDSIWKDKKEGFVQSKEIKKCQECGRNYFILEEYYDESERKLCGTCSYRIKNLKKSNNGN